jgi:hypothetical protein
MILLRRFLVLAALMFWQGGFTFYAGVVVPIGADVLGSAQEQGFITRHVTGYLNLAGVLALGLLGWDVVAARDAKGWRRWARRLAWAGMVLALAFLMWLHPHLDQLLDAQTGRIRERSFFRTGHRWYLWVSTAQWALAILYTLTTLAAWRAADRIAQTRIGGTAAEAAEAQKNVPLMNSSASPSHRSHRAAGLQNNT